jgi:RNA recognition motif-containing protein
MGTKLYVGNMSYKVTTEDLQKRFSEAGEVVSVNIVFDKFTGQSKGFGFVEMATEAGAQEAIRTMHNAPLYGRGIVVNEARPQTDRGGDRRRPGGGGGFKSRGGY